MRAKGFSRARAAAEAGTTPRTMQRHVGRALRRQSDGTWAATKWDRIPRTMRFLTENGVIDLVFRDSRQGTAIAKHIAAVTRYLRTGDASALKPFRGKALRVGKVEHRFVTHLRTLERLAFAGEIAFEDLYAQTTGETK